MPIPKVHASYVSIRIVPGATMPPKGLAIHVKVSIHSLITLASHNLHFVVYSIAINVEALATLASGVV